MDFMINVTIYSKKNCHLCEIAIEQLLKIQTDVQFSLTEVDIEKDSAAYEKYKFLIPVIEIDGNIVFHYKINENEMKKILKQKLQ